MAALKINTSYLADEKLFFRNCIAIDDFDNDFHLSRKKWEKQLLEQELQLDDFCTEEVDEFFRSCAVDPGVRTLLMASMDMAATSRRFVSFPSRNTMQWPRSSRSNHDLNKQKEIVGIKRIESEFPTDKTADTRQYQITHTITFSKDALFEFYNCERAKHGFCGCQRRQRELEVATNILINGRKKIRSTSSQKYEQKQIEQKEQQNEKKGEDEEEAEDIA